MKFFLSSIIVLVIFSSSCQSPEEKAAEKARQDSIANVNARFKYKAAVDSAETLMQADKNYSMQHAMGTLKAYNDYILHYPKDTITAEYLFRAADLAMGAKQYTDAANHIETILANHKDYRKYPDALFVGAYIYDMFLEDVNHGGDRAKQLYQFLIDKYPETNYAAQAKVLITYIGVPEDQMLDDIIKKGQEEEKAAGKGGSKK